MQIYLKIFAAFLNTFYTFVYESEDKKDLRNPFRQ